MGPLFSTLLPQRSAHRDYSAEISGQGRDLRPPPLLTLYSCIRCPATSRVTARRRPCSLGMKLLCIQDLRHSTYDRLAFENRRADTWRESCLDCWPSRIPRRTVGRQVSMQRMSSSALRPTFFTQSWAFLSNAFRSFTYCDERCGGDHELPDDLNEKERRTCSAMSADSASSAETDGDS